MTLKATDHLEEFFNTIANKLLSWPRDWTRFWRRVYVLFFPVTLLLWGLFILTFAITAIVLSLSGGAINYFYELWSRPDSPPSPTKSIDDDY